MANHVNSDGEPLEQLPITVAINPLLSIKESVVVAVACSADSQEGFRTA
jgi:hypothetical protein